MQNFSLVFSAPARRDLAAIFIWLRDQGVGAPTAAAYLRRIRTRCRAICDAPHGGRMLHAVTGEFRVTPFERRVMIVYIVENETVRIARIFYGGQDYETLMNELGS